MLLNGELIVRRTVVRPPPSGYAARVQFGNLFVGVTQTSHHTHRVLAGERTMLQALRNIGKINYGAVPQIFSETRTVDLHYPSGWRQPADAPPERSNITVGSCAGNVHRRQELFPLIGRASRKDFSHFPCKLSVVFRAGSALANRGSSSNRPVHRATGMLSIRDRTGKRGKTSPRRFPYRRYSALVP